MATQSCSVTPYRVSATAVPGMTGCAKSSLVRFNGVVPAGLTQPAARVFRFKGKIGGMGALLAVPFAAAFGLLAGAGVALLILAWPFAWAYDLIQRYRPRRAPRHR